jgi:hypothetical protein
MSTKVIAPEQGTPNGSSHSFTSTASFGSWVGQFVDDLNIYTQTIRDQKVVFPSCRIIAVPPRRQLSQSRLSAPSPEQEGLIYAIEIASPSTAQKNGSEIVEEIMDELSANLAVAQLMSKEQAINFENLTPMVEILRRGPTEKVRAGSREVYRVVMTVRAFCLPETASEETHPAQNDRIPLGRQAEAGSSR